MKMVIKALSKYFNDVMVLENINLTIEKGEIVALLGPSGCGKTTLLRIIAGLERQDQGEICINDTNISELSSAQRKVGFMFQNYALFNHFTVFDNVAFGLNIQARKNKLSKQNIKNAVHDLLETMQLLDWKDYYPHALSGGQKQRVALARALAISPQIILLDEPFAALDTQVRQSLRAWLRHLLKSLDITSIFVTHDQEEAFEMADRIVVMNQGKIEQIGSAENIYSHPETLFVQNFIGQNNQIQPHLWHPDLAQASDEISFIRPHDIHITYEPLQYSLQATLTAIQPLGATIRLTFKHLHFPEGIRVETSRDFLEKISLTIGSNYYLTPRECNNIKKYSSH